MEKYNSYLLEIAPISGFLTPLQSDTIIGHLLWALKDINGEAYLLNMLDEFRMGNPPFVCSDAFPSGYLPRLNNVPKHILHSEIAKAIQQTEGSSIKQANIKAAEKIKMLKNQFYMPKDKFLKARTESISNYYFEDESNFRKNILIEPVTKNTINRLNNTTVFETQDGQSESGLYEVNEVHYLNNLDIYFKVRTDFDISILEKALYYIEKTGYGKKKSSGKGEFKIVHFSPEYSFAKDIDNANGFVTLSNYCPKEKDFIGIIYADLGTKRGKVSGGYQYIENPFKKPIVHYKPGSIFISENPSYLKGACIGGISDIKDIIQVMQPFTLEVKLIANS